MFKFYTDMPGDQRGLFWTLVIVVTAIYIGLIFLAVGIISAFS